MLWTIAVEWTAPGRCRRRARSRRQRDRLDGRFTAGLAQAARLRPRRASHQVSISCQGEPVVEMTVDRQADASGAGRVALAQEVTNRRSMSRRSWSGPRRCAAWTALSPMEHAARVVEGILAPGRVRGHPAARPLAPPGRRAACPRARRRPSADGLQQSLRSWASLQREVRLQRLTNKWRRRSSSGDLLDRMPGAQSRAAIAFSGFTNIRSHEPGCLRD